MARKYTNALDEVKATTLETFRERHGEQQRRNNRRRYESVRQAGQGSENTIDAPPMNVFRNAPQKPVSCDLNQNFESNRRLRRQRE